MNTLAAVTENIPLRDFAILLLFEVFDILGGILLSFIIMRERPKRKIYPYIIVVLFSFIYALSGVFSFEYRNDLGYIFAAIAPLIVFKLSKKRSYKYCALSFGYDLISGLLTFLVVAVMGNDFDALSENVSIIYSFVVAFVLFIIMLVTANIAGRKADSEALLVKIRLPLLGLIITTATVFAFTLIHYQINFASRPTDFLLSILNMILFGVTMVLSFRSSFKSRIAEENYKVQLALQIQRFEMLEKKNEEIRIFRHDMPKKLRPLAMYLDERNYEEAKHILDDFNVAVKSSKPRYDTGNYRLDTVLEAEQQLAEKQEISIKLIHGSVFPKDGIAPEDIYTIFPNAIDNAIEACAIRDEKSEITFESHIIEGKVYIKITNPFSSALHTSGGKLITTKQDKNNHGYGFRSIKKAAAKYGSDNVSFTTEDDKFILMISLEISA